MCVCEHVRASVYLVGRSHIVCSYLVHKGTVNSSISKCLFNVSSYFYSILYEYRVLGRRTNIQQMNGAVQNWQENGNINVYICMCTWFMLLLCWSFSIIFWYLFILWRQMSFRLFNMYCWNSVNTEKVELCWSWIGLQDNILLFSCKVK